jgi:hypothetical protein
MSYVCIYGFLLRKFCMNGNSLFPSDHGTVAWHCLICSYFPRDMRSQFSKKTATCSCTDAIKNSLTIASCMLCGNCIDGVTEFPGRMTRVQGESIIHCSNPLSCYLIILVLDANGAFHFNYFLSFNYSTSGTASGILSLLSCIWYCQVCCI